jgi:hypothetical protein
MRTWDRVLTIPGYLVQGIKDNGMEESYDDTGIRVEADDLRISIELSTGLEVLLDGHQRIIVASDGALHIEALVEIKAE